MNKALDLVKKLPKTNKIIIMVMADAILAFICWLIFGPPLTGYLASNFELRFGEIIFLNIGNLNCRNLIEDHYLMKKFRDHVFLNFWDLQGCLILAI